MKKQNLTKLEFLITGLKQRNIENENFFMGMNLNFKSGRKDFPAQVVYKKEEYQLRYKGRKDSMDFDGICSLIVKEAAEYDSLTMEYVERGTIIMIDADNKGVNIKYADNINEKEPAFEKYNTSQLKNREYLIKVGPASKLLKEIGILTADGKLKNDKIRKYNQIDHFVELVDGIIKDMMHKDCITVVDCACGKSYLSFVLNYYIKDVLKKNCHFIGIDNAQGVIDSSREMAKSLGYNNMEFVNEDLASYEPEVHADIVMSLHACDIATDMAIALGIRAQADAIVAVPCCHKELLDQYSFEAMGPVLKHGVFKARFADLLTDGLRSALLEGYGYDVSAIEYISPLDTPKNLMIRAIRKEDGERNLESYNSLKKMFKVDPIIDKLVY